MAVPEGMAAATPPGSLNRKMSATMLPLGNKPFDLQEKLR